ncbi:MAG: 30S ribosomal protein S20 [Nitriliruptoraceae bacterium]
MANIKSQIKRNRQNDAARERNRRVRTSLKTKSRRFREAVQAGDASAATDAYREAARAYDKAATKGIVHRNQAANRKSRMARQLQSL